MRSFLRLFLMAGLFLTALPSWGEDQLPMLPSSGPAGLPTLSSSPMNVTQFPDKMINVTCYLGNPNDRQTLGSITATTPAEAGANCNSLNYACRGRCFGCYSDFDLSEDICVDASGRKYLK